MYITCILTEKKAIQLNKKMYKCANVLVVPHTEYLSAAEGQTVLYWLYKVLCSFTTPQGYTHL